jgi:superfamily II DNA or RNA helicase
MRDTIENISLLQKQLNDLQLENQVLKNLLDQSGISYMQALKRLRTPETVTAYDPDQGARIIHPEVITPKMANEFYSWFWGRQDVYAKRSVKKATGEAGYYPQCHNFWTNVCPRKRGQKINCKDCSYQSHKILTKEDILRHLQGRASDASDVIGIYPLLPNGTCRFLVFDFDNHEKAAAKRDYANTDDIWVEEVEAVRTICTLNGIEPLVERSRSGRGAHIWLFFDKPLPASLIRKFGFALLAKGAEQINLKSFKYYDRMLPAQDMLPEGGIGNLIALPLQGRALRDGNSAFIDRNWNAYPEQWAVFQSKPKLSKEFLEIKLSEWTSAVDFLEDPETEGEEREKPWKGNSGLSVADVEGNVSLTLSNGIYVDSLNLKPRIQNKIRRLAAFGNPVYYRNNAIGTSNFDTPRWIYLGKDHLNGYIQIPRGLYDILTKNLSAAGIHFEVADERQPGNTIRVSFQGELREEQRPALQEMMKHDNGILHAATAFGKTVVCSAMIAERKVNTLIILESSALIDQWKEALEKFLLIDEKLPEYQTKTGRVKTRKSLIGVLQAQHDSTTGIIDIAMAGSLCKKGEPHQKLNQYGMVIVDECHHAASGTISNVLQEVKARYVYGVTATPIRGDGLERINYMLLGPVRYRYTSKERAEKQGIDHLVYPRFTRTVMPRGLINEKMHPNEAYELIRNNEVRDELILKDVRECVQSGRTPVVLSRYKDHSERLYERVKVYADHVFLLTGNNSKREHRQILSEMQKVAAEESMILVATGSLIGEGFDYPRLDTLIMATPVSFKGVVEQYAGRLNRDYAGKKNVIVYDYVDSHIPMFDNMYAKRLKAYKQIGYDVCGGINGKKQAADAIYDSESFQPVFQKDLLEARETIVISSPAISGPKVHALISLLKDQMTSGVSVTLVTWEPDLYGFGDPAYWMQLHEEIRQAGFYIKQQDESCERFAVIDQEIVWYGGVNLLARSDAEQSIMRVPSKKIAAELMELAFGAKDS